MPTKTIPTLVAFLIALSSSALAQTPPRTDVNIANVRMRDACVLADEKTKTYYLLSSLQKSKTKIK